MAPPRVSVCLKQGQVPGSCGAEQVRFRHCQAGHCRGFRRSDPVRVLMVPSDGWCSWALARVTALR